MLLVWPMSVTKAMNCVCLCCPILSVANAFFLSLALLPPLPLSPGRAQCSSSERTRRQAQARMFTGSSTLQPSIVLLLCPELQRTVTFQMKVPLPWNQWCVCVCIHFCISISQWPTQYYSLSQIYFCFVSLCSPIGLHSSCCSACAWYLLIGFV